MWLAQARWAAEPPNPDLSDPRADTLNPYTLSSFFSSVYIKGLLPSPSPITRHCIFWKFGGSSVGWPQKNKAPQVEELLFLRFLKNRKLPGLPAINPSLPSFVISPREQHSRMTHLGGRQEISSGDWRWPWPGTHILCLFSHLSSGQPRPPRQACYGVSGWTLSVWKIIFKTECKNRQSLNSHLRSTYQTLT